MESVRDESSVEVLLSSYNGAQHLREQIDSVLRQDHRELVLTIRDDGSTDDTRAVLRDYGSDKRVHVRYGDNLGLPGAYFQLLNEAGDAPYLALADQDDVWLPDKLSRAVRALAPLDAALPALYCSRVEVVDQQLRSLGQNRLPSRGLSFANALVQNVATGCTMVINRAALDMLRGRWPSYAVMHDAWIYLVVSGTGVVVYDPEPSVLYRQHGRNVVGLGRSSLVRLANRMRRQLSAGGAGAHGRQNRQLRETHGHALLEPCRQLLDDFLDSRRTFFRRARYAFCGSAYRQDRGSDAVFRLLYLINRV
jgi:glycosyltransferase involved in cell wall biosynthesis